MLAPLIEYGPTSNDQRLSGLGALMNLPGDPAEHHWVIAETDGKRSGTVKRRPDYLWPDKAIRADKLFRRRPEIGHTVIPISSACKNPQPLTFFAGRPANETGGEDMIFQWRVMLMRGACTGE